jgi:aspartate/methionine/tyrosine aminotransferase
MPVLAAQVFTTPHSGIRRMIELAGAIPEPLMLVSGDPNFVTPGHIVDYAADAAREHPTGYAPAAGIAPLREAIADKVQRVNGIEATVDNVCVTTGGCGGLFTTLLILLSPGDELLVPDPGWSNYPAMAHVLHANAIGYPLDAAAGFALDPQAIEARVTPRTRAIILNSPSNPTGTVETRDRLRAVLDIADRNDLWVISDECYDQLVFEGEHVATATVGDSARVITVFTFSKSYAMTGWRVGYVVAPPDVARQLALHQEPVVSSASTVSQNAALAALLGPQDCVTTMAAAYRDRRDAAMRELDAAGVGYVRPRGAFYLMTDVSATGLGSWDAASRLLEDQGVAVVPGAAFGPGGEGFVRVSLAVAPEVVAEGARRIGRFMERFGK